jgi:hypothetical protein
MDTRLIPGSKGKNYGARALRSLCVAAVFFAPLSALAQAPPIPAGGSLVVGGLDGPRGMAWGPDGLLYVAEAGTGGTQPSPSTSNCTVPGPVGPYFGGLTARISKIESDGTRVTVVDGLPSGKSSLPSGDTEGVADVVFVDGELYAVTAGGGCSHGNPGFPNSVIRVNTKKGTFQIIANLSDFFRKHPVAHPNPPDFEPDGVPYTIREFRGDLLVVEPNHGQLVKINISGHDGPWIEQVSDISGPVGHVVPTSLAKRDGRFYVGNLGLFPVVVGSSKLYQVTHEGFVIDYWAGFTTVVDVHVDEDGRLYVLELSSAAGNPNIGQGRVLRITGETVEEIISGLNVPTAMAFGAGDDIYVSDLGAAPPGAGRILRFANPATGTPVSGIVVRKPAPLREEDCWDW